MPSVIQRPDIFQLLAQPIAGTPMFTRSAHPAMCSGYRIVKLLPLLLAWLPMVPLSPLSLSLSKMLIIFLSMDLFPLFLQRIVGPLTFMDFAQSLIFREFQLVL